MAKTTKLSKQQEQTSEGSSVASDKVDNFPAVSPETFTSSKIN